MANYLRKMTETSVRIPARFSYAHVFEPWAGNEGQKKKYSVSCIIDKNNAAAKKLIDEAIEAAKKKGVAEKWGGKLPANCKLPIHDGDEERPEDDNYENSWYFTASTDRKPGVAVLDAGIVVEAMDDTEFYSGCYGAVTVKFYPYAASGNKGIAVGLDNVIKTADGDRLGGGARSASSDFSDLAD